MAHGVPKQLICEEGSVDCETGGPAMPENGRTVAPVGSLTPLNISIGREGLREITTPSREISDVPAGRATPKEDESKRPRRRRIKMQRPRCPKPSAAIPSRSAPEARPTPGQKDSKTTQPGHAWSPEQCNSRGLICERDLTGTN